LSANTDAAPGATVAAGRFSRRRVLQSASVAFAPVAVLRHTAAHSQATPIASEEVPDLAEFDRTMTALMMRWDLPGSQLAVAKDGKLVFSRAYGLADRDTGEPVQPTSLFRIASVTKVITAVAILALIDDGLLTLDDKPFPLLDLEPPTNAPIDPRLADITIEHLLVHAGGWDSSVGFDPQYMPWSGLAAHVLGEPQPTSPQTIVRFMLSTPLDFDPGTRSAYSNFGYNVLGRVIEKLSGQTYDDFTQTRILSRAGIDTMRLGRTRLADRAPSEVTYYGPAGQPPRWSVYPGEGFVPVGYGSYFMDALDAHGGWIASAEDLVRFATAVDGQRGEPLLKPETLNAMLTTPRPPSTAAGAGNAEGGKGLGWVVTPAGDGVDWSHAGALEGSNAAWLTRTHDGLAIAFTTNTLPADYPAFFGDAITGLTDTAAGIPSWPTHDLFST
jgi:N-acyl-D-amino-acid deacylase